MAGQGSSSSWWYITDEDIVVAGEQTAVAVEENHSEPPPVAAPPALTIEDETAVAEEETAVAEEETAAIAAGAQPANDGQPDPQVFDLNYFQSFQPFTSGYKQHNAALKFFRAEVELQDDPMQSPSLQFHVSTPTAVAVIKHAPKGMTWEFSDEWTTWSWHEMIAQLDEASMEEVVTGPSGRSRGLVGCSFAIRPGSYDHKRHNMLIKTATNSKQQLPYWDFVVHREDGSGIRLHPQFKGTVVETIEEPVHAEAFAVVTVPPRRGLGRSDGPGTYKKYKDIGLTEKMRFDASKKP